MKLGFYSGFAPTLAEAGVPAVRELMQAHGFAAGEFFDFCIPGAIELGEGALEIQDAKDGFSAYSALLGEPIPLCCYSVAADFIKHGVAETEEELKRHVNRARELGSPFFHHTSALSLTGYEGMEEDRIAEMLYGSIARVAEHTLRCGLVPLYEPQGRVFNGEGFLRLMDRLRFDFGLKDVGVCMDFGNPLFADTDPVSILKELLPLVRHVHLKDYRIIPAEELSLPEGEEPPEYRSRLGKYIIGVPFTEGDCRLLEGISILERAGYDGYYSVESDIRGVPGGISSPRDADILRRIIT